jgi:regulatory protein
VHIDGAFLCTVSEAQLARRRLFKGLELTSAAVEELRREAFAERVLADAHRLLGHRRRATAELRRRLLAKGHDEEAVEAALARLTADGLLDDAAFARAFVHDKRVQSGWGRVRLERGLRELGVSKTDADAALGDEDGAGDDELARACALLEGMGPPRAPLEAARRRAYQALLRRGFEPSVAYAAVKRWVRGEASAS